MRRLSALLSSIFLISIASAQSKPEPIRLCVSTIKNSSLNAVDMAWQRNQLMKAFERINKGKDVTKGKVARIETVLLESNTETDPAVRENNCQFILHADLVELVHSGSSDMGTPRPRPVEIGSARGDPGANASDENRASAEYRVVRAGELGVWTSDVVHAHDSSPDEILVSHLMDQVANRVADEFRKLNSGRPQ
jgi:hypothetical protein